MEAIMGGRVWDEDLGEWVRAVDTEDEQRPVEKLPLETGPKGQRPVVVAPRSVEKSPSSCKNGHPWTPENTHMRQTKWGVWRECRACRRERTRKFRAK
jgi:hypothetical protein